MSQTDVLQLTGKRELAHHKVFQCPPGDVHGIHYARRTVGTLRGPPIFIVPGKVMGTSIYRGRGSVDMGSHDSRALLLFQAGGLFCLFLITFRTLSSQQPSLLTPRLPIYRPSTAVLLVLPNELLPLIATFLDDDCNIKALLQTSKQLSVLLNQYLYKHNVRHSHATALEWAAKHGHVHCSHISKS